jgi:hypothetical protein
MIRWFIKDNLSRCYYFTLASCVNLQELQKDDYQIFLSEFYTVSYFVCQRKSGKNTAISSFLRIKKANAPNRAFASLLD